MVLGDPATEKYRIDWERSALVNGLVPAQFTLEEDNTTCGLSTNPVLLQELEALRRSGAVTDQEYASKRAEIIAEI